MKVPKVPVVLRLDPDMKRRFGSVLKPGESMSGVGREQIIDLVLNREAKAEPKTKGKTP
jgi:hypothetical protein